MMEITPVDSLTTAFAAPPDPSAPTGESFDAVLRAHAASTARPGEKTDKVREAAEDFVAMALVEPVLAKMRSMNQGAGPFAPGSHEKAFAPLVDAAWSKSIVKASNWGLVDRIEGWLRTRSAEKAEATHA